MNYRTRYLNTLRGNPVDRTPFVEAAQLNMVRSFSDWGDYLADDPLSARDAHTPRGPLEEL